MKTSAFSLMIFLPLVIVASPLLRAQGGPPAHAGQRMAVGAGDDLAALDRFLSLSDAELDQLQQAIARVRAMTPAERAGLREKMLAYRRLPAGERENLRLGWGWLNEQDRSDWPAMMHALPPEEREAIRVQVLALPPEERAARKHALLEQWRSRSKPQ
ncbi:MAG TPA: DUF3106 domain-containing protein [Opitutaceae bacterium]